MPAPSASARRSGSATSTSRGTALIPTGPSGKRSRAARTSSPSATSRSTAAPMWAPSTSAARTSRRRWACFRAANVLLLDEPTNDLDVETLSALEDALEDFAGCAVVISHDRFFLDRLATHILAFEGDSRVVWFEGNFAAYMEDRKRRLGTDALVPHRIRYRKFSRT